MPTVSQGLASGNRPTGRDARPMMGGRGRDEAPKLIRASAPLPRWVDQKSRMRMAPSHCFGGGMTAWLLVEWLLKLPHGL